MAITGRGFRGTRVGEAANPGPAAHQAIASMKVWSQNISTFFGNGETLLKTAHDNDVCIVCLQETNVTKGSIPGAKNTARRLGWDMHLLQQPGSRKEGVAVLVKEPLGLSVLDSVCSPQFQLLKVAIHGADSPLTVLCAYRVPDEDDGFFSSLNEQLQAANTLNWLLCLDGNQNQLNGPLHDLVKGAGGSIAALARHSRSSHPIDAVWASTGLHFEDSVEIPEPGDHCYLQCCLELPNGPRCLENLQH